MFCTNCGYELKDGDLFCPKCGTKVEKVIEKALSSDVVYATFLQRVGAYLLDTFFLLIFLVIMLFIFIQTGWIDAENIEQADSKIDFFNFITGWLYFALQESSAYQATLGKRIVGIKVADYNLEKITFLRATGRYFSKIISTIPLFIGFLMPLFTQKRQALHDMIARTVVIGK